MPRERLPDDRRSVTHKFTIGNPGRQFEGYLTVGLHPDGRPGELFIKMSKQGSIVNGLMNGIGVLTSLALQSGITVQELADKFSGARFEPYGPSESDEVGECSSVLDYVFRWLCLTFPQKGDGDERRNQMA